jgi:carboxyl-terminal processing protease
MPRLRPVLAALAVALLALAAGAAASPRRDAAQPYRSLDTLAEVLAYVENNYVDEVKEKELVYAAIDGMLQHLDPHSVLLRPEVYRAMKDETSGEFDGVGLEVTARDDEVVVVAPIADTPAERAGIRAGDRITAVDGTPTKDLPLPEVIRRMKGPAGTKVVVEVMRPAFREPLKLTLVRDHVRTSSVDARILDPAAGIAYVRIRTFQDRTDRQLEKTLADVRARLGGEIRGMVLDLRNDPGGLLEQAVRVADRFLRSGVIVTTEGRGQRAPDVERAHEKDTEPDYPMVVLVNRGSASASEIVAGALQDHGRATIVGTNTFGKASVQTVIELDDGSALKLTVAKYYTPKHRAIHDVGIRPDVQVADAPEAATAVLGTPPGAGTAATPAGTTTEAAGAPSGPRSDLQLERALEILRKPAGGTPPAGVSPAAKPS